MFARDSEIGAKDGYRALLDWRLKIKSEADASAATVIRKGSGVNRAGGHDALGLPYFEHVASRNRRKSLIWDDFQSGNLNHGGHGEHGGGT